MRLTGRAASVHTAGEHPTIAPGEELIPGFRAVARLAHGRRLDTWDAIDEERDVRCIVKLLRPERRVEPDVVAAVLREGEVVTTLSHPHLVRGYAVVEDPPAIVMETLRGATLGALVEEHPLNVDDAALMGLQLCSVLGYLHRHDWLHLDLKPANVVVEHDKAVLIDLSLAARPGDGRPGAGTRGYLAPEQVTGTDLSAATDVWGLGVTLIESLSGELPFGQEASRGKRARWRPRRGTPDPTRLLPGDLPHDVRRLLLACIEQDAAARPRLVDVKAVLQAHLARSTG